MFVSTDCPSIGPKSGSDVASLKVQLMSLTLIMSRLVGESSHLLGLSTARATSSESQFQTTLSCHAGHGVIGSLRIFNAWMNERLDEWMEGWRDGGMEG